MKPFLTTLILAVLLVREAAATTRERFQQQGTFAGLSLRIDDESAPAGSIVQVKVTVTEPKPISTGKGKIKVKGLSSIEGIALMNRDQDAVGIALVDGDEVTVTVRSASSLFGTSADYPILAVAGTVDPGASVGSKFPLTIQPDALKFVGPAGTDYPLEIKNGVLTVANVISISDVIPGSSLLPAGSVVSIRGTNFTPTTRLQLSETAVAQTRFISSNQIDLVLAQSADMHGLRIRARNDNSEATYFSYQRTRAMSPSSDPLLSGAVPLFAPHSSAAATVTLPRMRRGRPVARTGASSSSSAYGFAIQNLQKTPADATIELLDASGHPYAVNRFSVSPDRYLVRSLNETFGPVIAPSAIRMTSNVPLQFLGVIEDPPRTSVTPIPPD
jgi:hypothetical protein